MRKLIYLIPLFFALFVAILALNKEDTPEEIALALLNSLDEEKRNRVHMSLEDSSRMNWHYLPWSSWERPGISLKEMDASQKAMVHKLLQSYLSEKGYKKVKDIISLEDVLAVIDNDPKRRDPDQYYLSVYGDPSTKTLWGYNFQGHHISLNFTIVDGKMSYTPRFYGANPAEVKAGPRKGFRALKAEEDLAMELVNSLDKSQSEKAIFKLESFWDIQSTNQAEIEHQISPLHTGKGLAIKDMNQKQQNLLFTLIDEYLSAMPKKLAEKRMAQLKTEEIDEIKFGWAGATQLGDGHYYCVQGETFLIEFDNTQNDANHIHTVWRDYDGDWGRDLIKEHYQSSNHHH
ncbi:DUF3500 domain-containing protein [Chondrinema litorale]|uniref:DUF3500 domain-containing protein n=1 Tax=Chondrinema litorale TaxID=2994555 RepID=UPI002542EBE6|nr:DUF3500 domain-containing protein [Chondrinema litorale]UZR98658.1 DUF3500 domain-containing protein [Chondrinema litorale]